MPKQNDASSSILIDSPTENIGITGECCSFDPVISSYNAIENLSANISSHSLGSAAAQLDSVDNVVTFPRTESRITRRARRASKCLHYMGCNIRRNVLTANPMQGQVQCGAAEPVAIDNKQSNKYNKNVSQQIGLTWFHSYYCIVFSCRSLHTKNTYRL